jgi:hypothetical protein
MTAFFQGLKILFERFFETFGAPLRLSWSVREQVHIQNAKPKLR